MAEEGDYECIGPSRLNMRNRRNELECSIMNNVSYVAAGNVGTTAVDALNEHEQMQMNVAYTQVATNTSSSKEKALSERDK